MKTIYEMYQHLNWANEQILEKIQTIEGDVNQIIRLFSHILHTERVWFTRLQGKDSSHLSIWQELDRSLCEELIEENKKMIAAYFEILKEEQLEEKIVYKNSKGTEYVSTIREILTHIALHGHYHRGQINLLLRANNFEPIGIDYITFVR